MEKLHIHKKNTTVAGSCHIHHHRLMTEGIGFGKNSAGLHITQKTGISPEIRGFNVNTAGKDDTCLGDKISEMKNYGIFFDIFFVDPCMHF